MPRRTEGSAVVPARRRWPAGAAIVLVLVVALAALVGPPDARATVASWVLAPPSGRAASEPAPRWCADRVPTGETPTGTDGLRQELAARFADAREAAAAAGIELVITSGCRSREQQSALVEQALKDHGDPTEAHRWVAPVERSEHVLGLAVDVGPQEAWTWLAEHGAEHGLCRVYDNEPWHFEALTAPGGTCPATVPDASGLWS
ncbi:D-alanyl-D-alanine carboxypeptidase family protein [Actinotalea sp. M2MS4P-6]|uniref:D-alanyl-D-alanine carboxypeptidase family protein n=1 Tax=Actinotalea sp. M2MS4P-6 TaxID=2983762 RepID=UPI0021E3BE5A|nr:D-alanyl-D-alanine carboxypeptidase family protein [Actinotalea sp. M2MS4P-6]MCV2395875.1 D-alanyl-D-alanine carboxypeptidase family protein [Actinotalea sp. M2MS4P-6]